MKKYNFKIIFFRKSETELKFVMSRQWAFLTNTELSEHSDGEEKWAWVQNSGSFVEKVDQERVVPAHRGSSASGISGEQGRAGNSVKIGPCSYL